MRWTRSRYLFLVLLVVSAGVLEGQTSSAPSAPAPAPPPSPVPVSQILPEANITEARLKKIQSRLSVDPGVIEVQKQLPVLRKEFDEWWASRQRPLTRTRSLKITHAISKECLFFQTRSASWNQRLKGFSKTVDAYLKELSDIRDIWTTTNSAVASEGLPTTVTRRIVSLLALAKEVEAQAKGQRGSLLSLQQQVTALQADILDTQEQIQTTEKLIVARLFQVDSPPLWKLFSATGAPPSVAKQFEGVRLDYMATLRQFLALNTERIALHVLILIGLTAVLMGLNRRLAAAGSPGAEIESALRVLSHPFYGALLVSLIATPLLYPFTPAIVNGLIMIVIVVPLLKLLPPLVPASARWIVYFVTVLFVLDIMRSLLPEGSALQRLFLLLLALFGLVTFWYTRRIPKEKRLLNILEPAGAALIRVLIPSLFALALLADVSGRVAFSDLLMSAVLGTLYTAVALYAGVRVLNALVTVATPQLAQWSNVARTHGELVISRFKALFRVFAVLMWLVIALHLFRVLKPIANGMTAILDEKFSVGSVELSLGSIAAFGLTLLVTYWFSRFIRFSLREEMLPRLALARGVPEAVSLLTYYMLLLIGFIFALAAAGADVSRITILASAFGVGLGFGLQDIVHNFVSGLILIFERPFKVGDLLQKPQMWGWVKEVGFRATIITTVDGADVIVPNSALTSNEVINWSRTAKPRRGDISVPVAYGTDFHQATHVLKEAARKHPEVLGIPEPEVLLDRFDENSLKLTLRFFARLEVFVRVSSELTVAVYDALKTAGIRIPFPQRDLHLYWSDVDRENLRDLKERQPPQAE